MPSSDSVRHGIVAFLGPASITSVVPGPSDLPIRYRMLTSWGRTTGEATLAVTTGDAGVSEIAYIGMLTAAAGSEHVNQITAAILFRVITWLLIIPVGLGSLGPWKLQLRERASTP